MSEVPQESGTVAKKVGIRVRHAVAGVTALAFVALLVLMPLGIGQAIKTWMLDNGATTAEIEDVDFNPFTGSLVVRKLATTGPDDARLSFDYLEIVADWTPLWRRRVNIKQLRLENAELNVTRSGTESLQIGGIAITPGAGSPAGDDEAWGIGIDDLEISRGEIRYSEPDIRSGISIEHLKLTNLTSWQPDNPGTLLIRGGINGAEITAKGSVMPFAESPAFAGEVRLDELSLTPFSTGMRGVADVIDGQFSVDSKVEIRADPDNGISLVQDGTLALNKFRLKSDRGDIRLDSITWSGRTQSRFRRDGSTELAELVGSLEHGPANLSLLDPGLKLSQGSMIWKGKLKLTQTPESTQVDVGGRLSLGTIRAEIVENQQTLGVDRIELSTDALQLTRDKPANIYSISHRGPLTMEGIHIHSAQADAKEDKVHWNGQINGRSSAGELRFDADGALTTTGVTMALPGRELTLVQDGADWKGDAGFISSDGVTSLQAEGNLRLGQFNLHSTQQDLTLIGFDELGLQGISITDPETLAVASISFMQLQIAKPPESPDSGRAVVSPFLATSASRLDDIRFSKQTGLSIERIEHDDLNALIKRDETGNLDVVGLLNLIDAAFSTEQPKQQAPVQDAPRASDSSTSSEKSALPIRVGELVASGNSSLVFRDAKVVPSYQARIDFNRLYIADIQTTEPHHESNFALEGNIGKHAKLSLTGKARFFDQRITGDLKGRVEALELPPLSPYTAATLGHEVNSGQIDADIDIRVREGKLEGKNRLSIYQLDVKKLDEVQLKKHGLTSVPALDTGLDMLRDKNNTIKLDVPIGGDLENPEFDPGAVINKAIASATKKGAKLYLTAALFPFGTLITVADIAGSAALKVSLDPVVFGAGTATLDETAGQYLQKLVGLLEERPKLFVKICGVAVEADRTVLYEEAVATQRARLEEENNRLPKDRTKNESAPPPAEAPPVTDEQLIVLADDRTSAIKEHLISKLGVSASRLVACQSEIAEDTDKFGPRADLRL